MRTNDILRFVMPDVIGCPEPTAELAVMQAAHELCNESGIWDVVMDPQVVRAGQASYELESPTGAWVSKVTQVWLDGRELDPVGRQSINPSQESGSPTRYATGLGEIFLSPAPRDSGASLVIHAELAPLVTAQVLPDFLVQRHLEAITSGAKARLMLQAGAPWANPQLGALHGQRAATLINDARLEALHERNHVSLRVPPKRFG